MEWPREEETLRTQQVRVEHLKRPAVIFFPFPSKNVYPMGKSCHSHFSAVFLSQANKRPSQSLGFSGRAGPMV